MPGFVSFGNDLLSGGGESKGLLSAKILLLYTGFSSVLSLAVSRLQKVRRHTDKNKPVYRKPSHLGSFRLLFIVRFKGVQLPFIELYPEKWTIN